MAVLFDQFGVLHDGFTAYDGAKACCKRLASAGVKLGIISNSGKRAEPNRRRLASLGFDPAWFDFVLTSGEVAHGMLRALLADGSLSAGAGVFVLSRGGDVSSVAGLNLTPVDDPTQAARVLIAGVDADLGLSHYTELLLPAASAGVPAMCLNPDLHGFTPDGIAFGAGRVAQAYADAGGPVVWIGKPRLTIFEAALTRWGGMAAEDCLMVGDSPRHDIAGAAAAGLQTCLIAGGVFAEDAEALETCPVPDFWATALS
ncbi:MAG: TIGR01459 family HAD-type hydrolase [Defluviimonas sp.]|uniref:TIGR01459 family HAD-type hydrolase n=1 Tax=Albidovulum sp. TaxID=1872424 RepID=UPI002A2C0D53|nr:TIGR01459 family HAD-type hydrolase [Defluviimonas sp.]